MLSSAIASALFALFRLFSQRLKGEQRLRQERSFLRSLLQRTPWWSVGHLALGLREFSLHRAEGDSRFASRLLSGARISAEAVIRLEGLPRGLGGRGNDTVVLRARALQGLVLIRLGHTEQGLDLLKHVLALNNVHRLSRHLREEVLEAAGSAAASCGDAVLAQEFLGRAKSLSSEASALYDSLRRGNVDLV